jgi:hypothetical protein
LGSDQGTVGAMPGGLHLALDASASLKSFECFGDALGVEFIGVFIEIQCEFLAESRFFFIFNIFPCHQYAQVMKVIARIGHGRHCRRKN